MKASILFSMISLLAWSYTTKAQTYNALNTQNLNFGMFTVKNNSSGTITINSNGFVTSSQDITLLNQNSTSAAQFLVTTVSVIPLNITVSASTAYLTNQFNQVVLLEPTDISPSSFTITALTPKIVKLGGTLTLTGDLPGQYSGSLDVIFTLNSE